TGSSSGTVANVAGNTANVRVVNGAPGQGSFDIYFQAVGGALPSSPVASTLAFGTATDFLTQPAIGENLIAQQAGSGSPGATGKAFLSCPLPQFGINAKYSVVIVNNAGSLSCELFQDFDYTGTPQYRAHNATTAGSPLAATAGFGTIAAPSAPPGTAFTVQTTGPRGNLVGTSGAPVTYTQAQPNTIAPFTGSVTFAVGNATSGTTPALATLDSRYIFGPNGGGTNQPNASGGLNFTGSVGTSIFAIDCTGTTVAPNVPCNAGVALVGYTDRL
ncbi:MAG: DUF4397 domain-containing protein, partial [Verrucomicrobiae bacterium]|nr:DUF4397 domain-containing protein [Verrucomicrobiae bacterium]